MMDLDKQIAAAQEALNDLVQTKQALEAMDKWDTTTLVLDLLDQINLLRGLGVVPAIVIYRDGTVLVVRHDAIPATEPIKRLNLRREA